MGKKFPDGVVMGTRGLVGLNVRDNKDPLNLWFVTSYKKKYGAWPLGPSYQYARSVMAYKLAMDKAAEGMEYDGPRGHGTMKNRHLAMDIYLANAVGAEFKIVQSFKNQEPGNFCKA